MKWEIKYRIKGDNNIKTEIVDVFFEKRNDVKNWWLSYKSISIYDNDRKSYIGYRLDYELINCSKIKSQ